MHVPRTLGLEGRGAGVGSRVVVQTRAIVCLAVNCCDLPGGIWDGLILLDKHVKRVDIVAA